MKNIPYKQKIGNQAFVCGAIDKFFSFPCQKEVGHNGWHEAKDERNCSFLWNDESNELDTKQ